MSWASTNFVQRHGVRLVALIVILALYGFARLPVLPTIEYRALARPFQFDRDVLPRMSDVPGKSVRQVNPSVEHLRSWISAMGAGIALNDIDGDGLANDICYVDTQADQVVVIPAPGTGSRYKPIVLAPGMLPFDAATMVPSGCLPGDFNEDGRIDLLVHYWGRTPIIFLRTGSEYRPVELAARVERWYTNAATTADLDGDGHVDVVVTNYFQDGAPLLDRSSRERIHMQHSMSRANNAGQVHVFRHASGSRRDGVALQEVEALPSGFATGWALAVGAADLDGDLLPELYIANDFGPDRLFHNRSTPGQLRFAPIYGRKDFTTPSSKIVGRDSFKGMGVDFGDLNGDGRLDFVVSNIAAEYALLESHFAFVSDGDPALMQAGIAPYVDNSEPLGLSRSDWGWDFRIVDFNNDAVPELIQATGFIKGQTNRWAEVQELAIGNDELLSYPEVWGRFVPGDDLSGQAHMPFYVKAHDGRYYDVAHAVGVGHPQVSRGIAVADVDGDGDLDYAVANQWEDSYLYTNRCNACGAFLGLHLRLPVYAAKHAPTGARRGHPIGLSRPAIGATARVYLPDGRFLVGEVDGGSGHTGKRSPDLHFGLGDLPAGDPVRVEVRWRDLTGVHTVDLRLSPGWHTVILADDGKRKP